MDELIPVFKDGSSADYADDTDDRKDSETRTLELPPILAVVGFLQGL